MPKRQRTGKGNHPAQYWVPRPNLKTHADTMVWDIPFTGEVRPAPFNTHCGHSNPAFLLALQLIHKKTKAGLLCMLQCKRCGPRPRTIGCGWCGAPVDTLQSGGGVGVTPLHQRAENRGYGAFGAFGAVRKVRQRKWGTLI